jgi:hypothetical protein
MKSSNFNEIFKPMMTQKGDNTDVNYVVILAQKVLLNLPTGYPFEDIRKDLSELQLYQDTEELDIIVAGNAREFTITYKVPEEMRILSKINVNIVGAQVLKLYVKIIIK